MRARPFSSAVGAASANAARRAALLVGVSAVALIMASWDATARPVGGSRPAPSAAAIAAAQSASQEAARTARAAQNSLQRATRAIQAQRASQQGARDAARTALQIMPSGTPNGLRPGGLRVAPGAAPGSDLWQGANLPTEISDGDRVKVTVEQTQRKALLTWQSFNIGERTDLRFDQRGNRDWVALNRVLDNTAPSKILGSIRADGSVYVINQNGIIFGGTSQVNVGALIASTATITNAQFLNTGIYSRQEDGRYVPSFTGAGGVIRVEPGALIETHAPAAVTSGGGSVLLMGRQVVNAGTITTPKGQTQLAAGDDFVLRRGYATDQNVSSTTRGTEIAPLFTVNSVAGLVRNDGMISSPQGDITLAGRTIEQNGVLIASTSVNARGTIHLLGAATDTLGSITFGADSVTTIVPELESQDTALNAQRDGLIAASATANQGRASSAVGVFDNLSLLADRLDQSRIEIVTGGTVVFKGGAGADTGSLTIAQGGQVAVSAAGSILVERRATIDVSGVRDVVLAMSANNLMVNIQGNELRDSPINRDNGYLRNANVWVDIRDLTYVPPGTGGYSGDRYYTRGGLLEIGGYLANTKHKIGEWAAVGGTITLAAATVTARPGSVFDISGGSIRYEGGYIRTTNFLGSDGRPYTIDSARGDMMFFGLGHGFIRKHGRWGVTEVWTGPFGRGRESVRWEDGYTVGRDAGQVVLSTPTAIFEGSIVAAVVQGDRQVNARPSAISDGYKAAQNVVAQAGTLMLGQFDARGRVGTYDTDVLIGDLTSRSIPEDRTNTAWFDAGHLNAQGLGVVDFATSGTITVDAPLSVVDGGSVSLVAATVDIKADITARSGRITATNHFKGFLNPISLGTGTITVASGVMLDARGLWVNARADAAGHNKLAFIDGGDVRLVSSGDVIVSAGSVIDVSSGGGFLAGGASAGGRGGNVTLKASATANATPSTTGRLTLDGIVRGYGVSGGGTLAMASGGTIVLGGRILETNGVLGVGEKAPTDLIAAEGFTVAAGQILPANFVYPITVRPAGQPIGAEPNITSITLEADWTPPRPSIPSQYYIVYVGDTQYAIYGYDSMPLPTIPKGSVVTAIMGAGGFPKDYVIPADVFPNGIPIPPTLVTALAGSPAPVNASFAAGTVIRSGSVLATSVAVRPLEYQRPDLLQSGFSQYDITGTAGVVVAPGTRLDVAMPVYRLGAAGFTVATGADPRTALELWSPPHDLDNPAKSQITQRAGANLSLGSAGNITLASGSAIDVDDGRSVTVSALGQITIDGSITARSGTITIASDLENVVSVPAVGQSIWIGEHAVLDVAARAITGTDAQGRHYAVIRDGGTINIGMTAFTPVEKGVLPATRSLVIIRPGALLNASGTSGVVDLLPGAANMNVAPQPVTVASNGGSIVIGSQGGLYLDGEMRAAAGGAGAAGGHLVVALETPMGSTPTIVDRPRTVTITQERQTSLTPGLAPGAGDPSLRYGEGYLSASQVAEGGFGSLSLWSRDIFQFKGNVNLATSQSLALYRGVLSAATGTSVANVSLAAPYVLLDGAVQIEISAGAIYPGLYLNSYRPSPINEGRLAVTADLIDVRNRVLSGASASYDFSTPFGDRQNRIEPAGFAEMALVSRGDVRLGAGALVSGGNIAIEAAQLYPTTGAVTQIVAGVVAHISDGIFFGNSVRKDGTLTIRGNGSTPAVPGSVFGTLSLLAGTIEQQGIVRAPLGSLVMGATATGNYITFPQVGIALPPITTVLRGGSITSTSAAGLVMPYGGTVDGLSYLYAGAQPNFYDLASLGVNTIGVSLSGSRVVTEPGSVIDLGGGGDLLGAAFISGRGGSVDVLRTALVNANPALGYSSASNRVYALVPGYAGSYAPISPEKGAGDPRVGQQMTLTQPAGGLPAGTYTLLPSTYALLPGAYRVELGGATTSVAHPAALANGSHVTAGTLGIANTSIRSALPTRVILTPGHVVRSHAHYNEMGYSQFAVTNAARFGLLRPRLPVDAQTLSLDFGTNVGDVLSFDGTVLMKAGKGGYAGNLVVGAWGGLEVKPSGSAASPGMASVDAEDLSRVGAGTLMIGGYAAYWSGRGDLGATSAHIYFGAQSSSVVVRSGSVLEAGQIFAVANNSVHVEKGAVFDTTRSSTTIFDSSAGYVFWNSAGGYGPSAGAILTVSNGWLNFLPAIAGPSGTVTIEDGAALRTRGTIAFAASQALDIGSSVALNARYLAVSLPEINVGTDASFAAARDAGALGSGWLLTQSVLDRLLAPADPSLARVERLTLTVGSSLNFFGSVALDLRGAGGHGTGLVINTPAIYGWGGAGDVAALSADTVFWNGVSSGRGTKDSPYVSLPPGAVRSGGPGTGSGTLTIDAREIVFGYDPFSRTQNEATLERLALGFSTVNLKASDRITANNRGALSVYRSGTSASTYAGGDLNITTPLLTTAAGGFLSVTAGGAIAARAVSGAPANTASVSQLGGELRIKGSTVTIDTAIALPSGRLEVQAAGGIMLTDRAVLDLSARSTTFFDVTRHSWGGDVVMVSAGGTITQQAGSTIDVSAAHNSAGSISATAVGADGRVAFDGALRGAAADGFEAGGIDIRSFTLADFAGLNTRLNEDGFFGTRSFVIKTGDLVIGDEVRAHQVNISVDGGSLTVQGRIDASGAKPGTIRLAARDDLTLASTAILDARSTVLQVDSRGAPIEASNRSYVELTSAQGIVRLASGATIDLRSADAVARGRIEINARRRGGADGTGAGADDIAIEAAGPLDIRGAASIAVNGFRRYEPAGGKINQSLLDAIHGDSTAFINAASANGALRNRLASLSAYTDAFHLRPGVELWSSGDLVTEGDLDLSGYRYGPRANPAVRGSGEPGVIVGRAGGHFTINGSISDGFSPPPATPDDTSWANRPRVVDEVAVPSYVATDNVQPRDNFTLAEDWWVPYGLGYSYVMSVTYPSDNRFWMPGDMIPAGSTIDVTGIGSYPFYWFAGMTVPATVIQTVRPQGQMWAIAPMLAPGVQSWSMRYVAGADLGAADSRIARQGGGNLVLDDLHFTGLDKTQPAISVVRTGTGYLDLVAGGNYRQNTLFGVYTAGTASGGLARQVRSDGTVLGEGYSGYEPAVNPVGMYFTAHGGDVLLTVGGNLEGYAVSAQSGWYSNVSSQPDNWLWQQQGSWGINFGTYDTSKGALFLRGFAGIGALGGGNVVIKAGGDAGETGTGGTSSHAVTAAIGSSGDASGGAGIVRSGGGTLRINVAGQLNPGLTDGAPGDLSNLRGNIDLRSASVGRVMPTRFGVPIADDPRLLDPLTPNAALEMGRVNFGLGDGALTVKSRGDIVATVNAIDNLWTDTTAAALFSVGGDINPQGTVPSLSAIAAQGSIYGMLPLKLLPSPVGHLELLAWNAINGFSVTGATSPVGLSAGLPISNLHMDDPEPVRIYAVTGDIIDLRLGSSARDPMTGIWTHDPIAKVTWMRAGRDIVKSGLTVLNNRTTDVSIVSAGRDIILSELVNHNYQVAGPGTLDVAAGRNIFQADPGTQVNGPFISVGPLVAGDLRPGAEIVLQAGVGSSGPAYAALAARYLNPANRARPGVPLADQAGKVAKTYEAELSTWLKGRFGFEGTVEQAIAYFDALPIEQRAIFMRQVYFAELKAGGREYNDPASPRFNSYLRGRQMIATLFPEPAAHGNSAERKGDITLFGGSGIHTDFGGGIQMLAPNGQIVIGLEGAVPPASAGVVTQGAGDIQMYSRGSVLLGLSRIMTTFGGDILIWSAEGDINAGRGAKGTIVYAPAKRVYDDFGGVTLSPNVPSTGAGIATLNPIPGVAPGDVDLIAPLGTIDAGEAGIRAGNVNVAALQILNAANIQAQGTTTGVPTAQAPNIASLTEASSVAGAAAQQAATTPKQANAAALPSIIIVEVLGYGGAGSEGGQPNDRERQTPDRRASNGYDPNSVIRLLGNGTFTADETQQLTAVERDMLAKQVAAPGSP
ncbi:filamentous haemagglutinin family protein [Reyranella sp. CPCC 100927]|uniref:filamentous haemagglutinin family protein n=1 Tax=Reyranella sp. CPCC 100927 TaxID=2599616 RepID=UPI0011B59766|nr:filamentous haemagglutinin family protein [Reyranella sp. CPCC 100927]TWT12543.1 filamentous hemagglutinin N-terminal domain-containing protein [Reyranella sp. CPCC 100927]